VVIDEIQQLPELFGTLRVLVDRPETRARFLVLGSASAAIVEKASQSLAGRVELVELTAFDLRETGSSGWRRLWSRGGFPRSFLASSDEDSAAWRESFIRTFLERDLPQLGISIPATAMRRFWMMLAHSHGQTWNASELARSLGVSDKTVRSYLDILTGTYMVRQLQPWHENIRKRQVKSQKIYFRDTGILHSLLALSDERMLQGHPKVGASWEGFVIEQILHVLDPAAAFFWSTHGGAELDLMVHHEGSRWGIEVKYNEAPRISRSMRVAMDDLDLAGLLVVYPGQRSRQVDERIALVSQADIASIADILRTGAIGGRTLVRN
jgi:predicted AAA+ superfamily ATPase